MIPIWLQILLAIVFFLGAFLFAVLTIDPFLKFLLKMHEREVENLEKNFEDARRLL